MSETRVLHISVSSMEDFLTCRRLYYYKRIKRYERLILNLPHVVGRVIHKGLNNLFLKKEKPITETLQYLAEERKTLRKTLSLTEKEEDKLEQQRYIIRGMLEAYKKRYGLLIRNAQLIKSEVEGAVQFGEKVIFVLVLDNLLRIKTKKVLHELKSSKYITPEYVARIQTNRQVAIYFYLYNIIFPDSPIDEIMYDVIRKPSIKLKKNESPQQFLQRLDKWYETPSDDMSSVFHVERFARPLITQDDIFNTIVKVSEDMLRCKDKEDYYKDDDKCLSYYGDVCPFYDLCHKGGETKENMTLYTIRKSHRVDTSNKPTVG